MTITQRNLNKKIYLALGIVASLVNSILFPLASSFLAMSTVSGDGFTKGMAGGFWGVVAAPFILLIGVRISFSLTRPAGEKKGRVFTTLKYLFFFIIPIMTILAILIGLNDPRSKLMQASSNGDINKVKKILSKSTTTINDVILYGGCDTHALKEAIDNGHLEIVKVLIDAGADIDIQPHAPVIYASKLGQYEIVNYLLSSGANISVEEHYKSTALKEAAENGHLEILKLLIDKDAIIKTPDKGAHAVAEACWNGHENIAKILLNNGADDSTIKEKGCRTSEEIRKECSGVASRNVCHKYFWTLQALPLI